MKKKIMREHKGARKQEKLMALEVSGGLMVHGRQQSFSMIPAPLCYHSLYHIEEAA